MAKNQREILLEAVVFVFDFLLSHSTLPLSFASRQPDLDAAGRYLGVFLFSHELDLGRPDIRMAT